MFIGMFMLVVLPLFLFVCARTALAGDTSGGAKFVRAMLYLLALFSVLGSVLIFVELLTT